MFFSLLLVACALFLLLLLNTFFLLSPTLLVFFLLRFTCFAPFLLLFLALLLASLLFFFLAALPLLSLCLLCPFSLALLLVFLFQLGLPLLSASVSLVLPLLFCLAPALFLVGCSFSADFLHPVFAHLGQALLLDQLVEQCVDSVGDVAIDVAALAGAFNECRGYSGVFGQ